MKISIQKVAFLSLLAGVLPACHETGTNQVRSDGSIPVTVLQPTTVELPRTYVADIQAIQFVEIKPKVEGYVKEVLIDEGEFVKKGQPMFRLSSENYAEAVKEAEANYKQTEAELEMANYETERIERLVNKQIYSPIRLEQAKREREVARMKVEQARAQMQRAQMDLKYTTITSPFTGYADRIPYKVGSLVSPESLLTTVSDISEIFAYYKVNESEYLRIRRAQLQGTDVQQQNNVELILADGTVYQHKGVIETVEGDFERGTGSIAFRVRFPNPEGLLKHGVTGKIRLMTKMEDICLVTGKIRLMTKMEDICLVPQKSTFEIQDFTYVYLVDSAGTAKVRSFNPIERYHNYYITDDLGANTTIVYEGVQMIRDGMHIKTDTIPFADVRKELHLENVE